MMLRRKLLSLVMGAVLAVGGGQAQTHTFPATDTVNSFTNQNSFAQISYTLFVGTPAGVYTTAQAGVTVACGSGLRENVEIVSAATTLENPATINGCTGVGIIDDRVFPSQAYVWVVNAYVLQTITGGYFTGSGSVAVSGVPGVNKVCAATSSSTCSWVQLTADNIAAGFTITGFSTTTTLVQELGASFTNPVFSASYSATPSSAQITNTDGVNSPFVLTTPFTLATVTGTFACGSSITTKTFTLSAVGSSTQTKVLVFSCDVRPFGGAGTAGATGATAVLTNATLVGATGTLTGNGLVVSSIGQTFGPYSPSGQKIYLLLTGNAHTFTSGGFSFPMNAPTSVSFTNVNGAVVPMYLYESTNTLTGTFNILVAS